jgi:shikimate kinase
MKNIVLIGFMGVGKGSVAREIVQQSDLVALDTDDIIESMENRSIKKIFAQEGEEYFRILERKVAQWLQKEVRGTLISTGGGFFKVPNLKKIGTVVYLSAPFETIHNRILAHPDAEKNCVNVRYFKISRKRLNFMMSVQLFTKEWPMLLLMSVIKNLLILQKRF